MKPIIIGIAGQKGSGKDTAASMIAYILGVGITKAKFQEWIVRRKYYECIYKDNIIHFADAVKDCVSIIFSIDRDKFDDRVYKDQLWFCIEEHRFIKDSDIIPGKYIRVNIEDLQQHSLNYIIEYNAYKVVIKLRTIMQYFATDICRKHLYDTIWIDNTMKTAATIAYEKDFCIIPDVRFENECNYIQYNGYGGKVILLTRNTDSKPKHSSEHLDFTVDWTINNNSSLINLFYNLLSFIQNIIL